MRASSIKYDTLRAEMARKNIGICDMSKALGVNRDKLSRKLSGKSPLYLDEAFTIQRALFSDIPVPVLFATSDGDPPGA